MNTSKLSPVVLVWYDTEADWAAIKGLAVDPERFEASYEDWVNVFDIAEERIWSKGLRSVRIHLDAESLSSFCSKKGLPCNTETRIMFAQAAFAVSRNRMT